MSQCDELETRDCKETTDTAAGRGGPANPAEGSKKNQKIKTKKTNMITLHQKKNTQSRQLENEKTD